jgi:hypothetical protein
MAIRIRIRTNRIRIEFFVFSKIRIRRIEYSNTPAPQTLYHSPPVVGGGELITFESRRALVLFHVLGYGTAQEKTEVLDCVRRTSKAPYDDMEEREICIGQKEKYNGAS